MSSTATTLSFLLLLSAIATAAATTIAAAKKPTVYEVLEEYDFPAGLLPTGVTDYKLNKSTGEFEVKLSETCRFTVQHYDLRYKSTISGKIVITGDLILTTGDLSHHHRRSITAPPATRFRSATASDSNSDLLEIPIYFRSVYYLFPIQICCFRFSSVSPIVRINFELLLFRALNLRL